MVLGDQLVQGIDYAYTLQGWLKGVNSTKLASSIDMGGDGLSGGIHQFTARDAVSFNLNYYDTSDYSSISGIDLFPGTMAGLSGNYRPLFNGNISGMAVNNRVLSHAGNFGGSLMFYNYRYDQLNRITGMDAYNGFNISTDSWSAMTLLSQFKERVTYDGNGNILSYLRHGHKTDGNVIMDNLSYSYESGTNKLTQVIDAVPDSRYGIDAGDVADIDSTGPNNYEYDQIGNLVKDTKEGLTNVKWSVYGKILEITRTATASNPVSKIVYTYDGQGNRISKTVYKNTGNKTYTWYVRDAQGNVMGTYSSQGNPADLASLPLNLSERNIYGSSRLGMYSRNVNEDNGPTDMTDSNSVKNFRGFRQYELSNHLGNVLATISDKKKGVDTGSDTLVDYFDADITTAQDYYPFGMLMPGRIGYQSSSGWTGVTGNSSPENGLPVDIAVDSRTNNQPPEYTATSSVELQNGFESGNGDAFMAYISPDDGGGLTETVGSSLNGNYRYGFNGKENDNDVKGVGNQQDYGMRIYNPRVGRFLSVDPITKDYPELTPYQFASNTPIQAIDLDGLEEYHYSLSLDKEGKAHLKLNSVKYENKHSFLGFEFNTKISERYIVEYNGENYYIGFHGAYGKGNEYGIDAFKEFAKNPNAKVFENNFLSETESYIITGLEGVARIAEYRMATFGLTSKTTSTSNSKTPAAQQKTSTDAGTASKANVGEGIIYERTDLTGKTKPYVGQTKSEARYKARQKEHQRDNPDADYEFKIIDRGKPGRVLDKKEQKALDARGGPTNKSKPEGGTSNKKNVIRKTG